MWPTHFSFHVCLFMICSFLNTSYFQLDLSSGKLFRSPWCRHMVISGFTCGSSHFPTTMTLCCWAEKLQGIWLWKKQPYTLNPLTGLLLLSLSLMTCWISGPGGTIECLCPNPNLAPFPKHSWLVGASSSFKTPLTWHSPLRPPTSLSGGSSSCAEFQSPSLDCVHSPPVTDPFLTAP